MHPTLPWMRTLLLASLIWIATPHLMAVTVSPTPVTVKEGATQQFTASRASTWTTDCGSISSTGLFKAPLYPKGCKITATATDGSGSASASANVVSPITMTPVSAKTPQGNTQQFTSSAPVNWSAKCGSITAGGLFTASAPVGTNCTIQGTASSGTAYTVYGFDTILAPSTFSISPLNPGLAAGKTQQFTASSGATWAASCGTISGSGLFTAPSTSGSCTITATATDGSGRTASTTATVTASAFTITPLNPSLAAGATQQFSASSGATWAASCGTISNSGLFTAPSTSSSCTITATATDGSGRTASTTATITAAFTITPLNPSVAASATQQFSASSGATWAASCGTISGSGLFTAPSTSSSCTITATATDGSGRTASTTATITASASAFTITPLNPNVAAGATQQFSASSGATWGASCGTISASGLFTAPSTSGSCTITATATDGSGSTASTTATITASAFTITPLNPSVAAGATQQFTASSGATWAASCGTISASGLFTAPSTSGYCTITATATDGSGRTTSTTATITAPFTITPLNPSVAAGATEQFTASSGATWVAGCGTIAASGLFTAPSTSGSCTITATATDGSGRTASTTATVTADLTITPLEPNVVAGKNQQFTASSGATWAASCGTISSSGLFTAPSTSGSCTITATATDSSGATASTTATITTPVLVTPASAEAHAIGKQQFTASTPVSWSASCGSINSSGLFTAPASAGSCVVTATATSGTGNTGTSTVTVDVVNYLSWKGGPSGTGAQTRETLLTPSNVRSAQFGVKWTALLDGSVYAQPLYMNGLTINGVPRNVVFAATSNDSIYAFDGDTGSQLWHRSFLSTGVTAVTGTTVNSPAPQIGILGTPVIDASTRTLYVVVETAEQSATYFPHRLHAIDVTNGNEKPNSPVLVSDVNLQPIHKLQRPGLTLANGMIYIGFGSISDRNPYHGLLFAFDEQTLAKKYVWNATSTGSAGSLWMSAGAPTVDAAGNLFVSTGNGTFDGSRNFGDAAVKLSPSLQVLDYFAPYNYANLSAIDADLGSSSVAVIPDQNGKFTHELVLCGKAPALYVLDADSMGHVGSGTDNIVQRINFGAASNDNCFGTPAFWGSNLYIADSQQSMKMFTLDAGTGQLTLSSVSSPHSYGSRGAQVVVSANGSSNGIVWTLDAATGQIFANDAANLATQLYSGSVPYALVHFAVPTVANGHVYVGSQRELVAYSVQ